MPIWHGEVAGCYWSFLTGTLTDDDWKKHVEFTAKLAENLRFGHCTILSIIHKSSLPTASQRLALANALKSHSEWLHKILGHAFVTSHPLGRGVLTVINSFVKQPYPVKVFGQIEPALKYLSKQDPSLVSEKVIETMKRTVPPAHYWND